MLVLDALDEPLIEVTRHHRHRRHGQFDEVGFEPVAGGQQLSLDLEMGHHIVSGGIVSGGIVSGCICLLYTSDVADE